MKRLFSMLLSLGFYGSLIGQPLLNFEENKTVTYEQAIEHYRRLDRKFRQGKLFEAGRTDSGLPLHLFVISKDGDFDPVSVRKKGKSVIMVMNGIHPGEPCGIDASIQLSSDLLEGKFSKVLENTVICIIPVYNTDGSKIRGCCSRANQNGPEEYGFRGNARNLDLNRDFIKCDSENARSFVRLFRFWQPQVFIDTHTTNGADYQYTMTIIPTQHNKLHPLLGNFLNDTMVPALYNRMKSGRYEMAPYVHSISEQPDGGILGFLETPRYSTGYAALFNTIGFVTEAHMLKPYKDRVWATYDLLYHIIDFTNNNSRSINLLKKQADEKSRYQKVFPLSWKINREKADTISFKGYQGKKKVSGITGMDRLYYDRSEPYEKTIPFNNHYFISDSIVKPDFYILPQAWREAVELFKMNGVVMKRMKKDTVLNASVYYIENFQTVNNPYEGHYLHTDISTRKENQSAFIYKGDYIIETNQACNRFIVEILEPEAVDSYFAWNFFDEILQQKEWFSEYVFEDTALELLEKDSVLNSNFQLKKLSDPRFGKDTAAQLLYIYRNSPYYEKSHKRYPVFRIENEVRLPSE